MLALSAFTATSAQRVNGGPVNGGGGGAAADLARGKDAAKKADPDAPMADQPLASQKPNRPPPPPPAKEVEEGSEEDDASEKKKRRDDEGDESNGAAAAPRNATAGGNSTSSSSSSKPPLRSDTNDFKFPVSWPTATIKHSLVKYWDGNVNLTGYLAYSNATLEKRPCVVIVPGSSGIGNFERWRADMLASNGYVAFVADLYGNKVKQGPAMPVKTRAELVKAYVTNEGLMKGEKREFFFFLRSEVEREREREERERKTKEKRERLTFFIFSSLLLSLSFLPLPTENPTGRLMTALNAVRNLPPVAQGKVVAVGWAFGGAAALQLFRASSEADGLLGVAAFSPAPVVMSTVASAPMAPGPGVRLALFIGSGDQSNRRRDIDTLRAELATSKALYTWTELGGAVAGFSQADLPTKDAAAAAADAAVAAVASGGDDVEGGTDNPRPKRYERERERERERFTGVFFFFSRCSTKTEKKEKIISFLLPLSSRLNQKTDPNHIHETKQNAGASRTPTTRTTTSSRGSSSEGF